MKFSLRIASFSAPIIALAISFGLSSLILLFIGKDPIETFQIMFEYGIKGKSIVSKKVTIPALLISAIAVAVGFKMGLFNIGVEGQYLVGSIVAAFVGSQFSIITPLHILFIILIAVACSAMWAAIAGYLKVKKGIHEVISTIMLNYIGTGLISYSLTNVFDEKGSEYELPRTPELPETGQMPALNNLFRLEDLQDLHGFLFVAIIVGIFYYWLVWKTTLGFDLRITGSNPVAAKFSGINPNKLIVVAMVTSGGFAGLVGLGPLLGYFHRFTIDFPTGLGFAGIAVALLGRNHPFGMGVGDLLFAFFERSYQILDLNDVPKEIERMLQAFILLIVVVFYEVIRRFIVKQQVKDASKKIET